MTIHFGCRLKVVLSLRRMLNLDFNCNYSEALMEQPQVLGIQVELQILQLVSSHFT